MEHLVNAHTIDLVLILLGFSGGLLTSFRLPIALTVFMIRIIKWWMETHPDGIKMSRETDLNEEFHKLFGIHLHDYDGKLPTEPKQEVDNQEIG